jgi:hypothetical protein
MSTLFYRRADGKAPSREDCDGMQGIFLMFGISRHNGPLTGRFMGRTAESSYIEISGSNVGEEEAAKLQKEMAQRGYIPL